MKRERRDRIEQAWHIGNFSGVARLPPLAFVLDKLCPDKPPRQQTPDEMFDFIDITGARLEALAAKAAPPGAPPLMKS